MLSVIVPTHNRRALLEKKLRLLEVQRGEFEVVVVADGCTDGTLEFLSQYRPPFPFRFLELAPGLGAAGARNRGAQAATGDILLFSDDDVMPQPGWIEAHQKAHAQPRVVAVGRLELPPELRGTGAAELRGPRAFWWNVTGNNTSLPKALFEEVGGYDPAFSGYGGEDPDLGYRLMRAGARLVFLGDAVAVHEAFDYRGRALEKARQAGAAHVRVWRKHGDPRIAWALGVHPVLLAIKLALLPSFKGLLGARGDYELAYAWGASDAWNQSSAS
ncbi:Hyaluronan synthase [Meiothermus luteus]|jgi:GT2 family glycosyltransferase|uniref:Hyaluronan synthase n=1 Tax=Meiothermus luteus TaxID=2026184 RepID=A0A399EUW7_9DEIN|nr:glycosyltransferase [Meiothermus luteus]RIH87415.1 Hyaluronan synthase [Meiothermus luteus]RMH58039.1 MAG: glycosyltransferase [Deinococcota bacterium]